MNKKIFIIIFLILVINLFFHFYRLNNVPPCINADEAAFSYNSYSLLKTGRDEYGNFLPLRLTSFGDYKMPLLSYLNIPFVAFFGLNKISIKLLNSLILVLFTLTLFFLTKTVFKKNSIAILTIFLFSTSWIIHSFSRQLHEALLTSFLTTLSYFFLIKGIETKKLIFKIAFLVAFFLSLFSYHSARIFALFWITIIFYFTFVKRKLSLLFLINSIIIVVLFTLTDFFYQPTRVKNLLFVNHQGFTTKIEELRKDYDSRLFYNKLTIGGKYLINEYLKYFSPQFLTISGDENNRFGDSNLSPITFIEYIFLFIGIYYLFKNKEKWRLLLMSLLFISPLSGSLSWAGLSVSRTFFIFIPIFIIVSYGIINFLEHIKDKKNIVGVGLLIFVGWLSLNFLTWHYYFYQYSKKVINQQAWQCGYQQLTDYIKKNYSRFDKFYITKESGPPYVFLLFFFKYPPEKIQKEAKLGNADIYGFKQIEKFDKFIFRLDYPANEKNIVVIGRPWEIPEEGSIKILYQNNPVFWVREIR